jgi:hypothetical protein
MTDIKSKVAVVVVHGVAYHAPGASAQAASELLHGLRLNDQPSPYGADVQETVSIPLHQLKVLQPLPEVPPPNWVRRIPIVRFFEKALRERTVFLTRAWTRRAPSDEPADERVANDFMRLLLQSYRGVDNPVSEPVKPPGDRGELPSYAASYVTTCIKLTRNEEPLPAPLTAGTPGSKDPSGLRPRMDASASTASQGQTKEAHIYEMYWADLSRPKNTILSFFQALYQLLFHLGSLSRLAISTGSDAEENRKRKVWRWLDWTQLWTVRLLTLPIPVLNVILFISLAGALPHLIYGDKWVWRTATALSAVIGLIVCAIVSERLPATPWPATWVAIPLFFAVISGALAWFLVRPLDQGTSVTYRFHLSPWSLLAIEGWLIGAAIIYLSVGGYDEVRDGAKEVAWTLYAVFLTTFLAILYLIRNDKTCLEQATLWMMQIVLAALRASWALLILLAFVALILGSIAWRTLPVGPARARAKASVRTSRFALAMPTLGILVVTLALWSALFVKTTHISACAACPTETFAAKLFGAHTPETLTGVPRWLSSFFLSRVDAKTYSILRQENDTGAPDDYFRGVFVWAATPAFPLVLALILAGFFLLLLWLVPSIVTERQPPRGSENSFSRRMGVWLSRGLDSTVVVVILMWTAAFVFPPLFAILHEQGIIGIKTFQLLDYPTALTLQWLGLATGSLAILASLAKSGSSVLGVILDVDNYLRTSPKERTPRARIVERYVSLLRYLSDDKQKHGGYDRIVILAHSLGAVISGDLLLYLNSQGDPSLGQLGMAGGDSKNRKKIDLKLFTMGDPLRQFLNRFFPYLYEWVRGVPDNTRDHLGQLDPTPAGTPLDAPPHPGRLGADLWINAYRSGDYIGRSIWLNEWYDRSTADPGAYPRQGIYVAMDDAVNPRFAEMCIGAGAHQHYWDQSAPDIAEKLDFLIAG